MRISAADLQVVRRAGMLTRYALLGPAAFVVVELPSGTDATGLEQPCLTDHHGIVTRGTFTVHHKDGRSEAFNEGDAFYVPAGPPSHHFTSSAGCIVGGFAATQTPTDTSGAAAALRDLGFSVVRDAAVVMPPPSTVQLAGAVEPFRRRGSIDVEGAQMGAWLFMRSRFGPRSGFTSGWCDLAHWGLVLDGEIAITYEDETELAARGDVFYARPGHRFTSPDGATIVDYTPIAELGADRIATWRRAAITAARPVIELLRVDAGATPSAARGRLVLSPA